MSQYHFNPETHEAVMAEEVPSYGRLQNEVAAATRGWRAVRILDLGPFDWVVSALAVHRRLRQAEHRGGSTGGVARRPFLRPPSCGLSGIWPSWSAIRKTLARGERSICPFPLLFPWCSASSSESQS
jgi:hypothetical protein